MRIFLLVAVLSASACSASSTGIATVSCPADSALSYTNFGQSFFADNCLSCHTSQQNPRLASQAEIIAAKEEILQEAVYTDGMPAGAAMAVSERELLGEWLACGAP